MNIFVLDTLTSATKAAGIPAKLIVEGGVEIPFLYNPESKSYSRTANYAAAAVGGVALPEQNYTGGTGRELTLSNLLLDSYCAGKSLRSLIESLEKLLLPVSVGLAPPKVSFLWGSDRFGLAVVTSLSWEETAWLSGEPAMARVNLSLLQIPEVETPTSLTQSPTGEVKLTDRQRATARSEAGKWLSSNAARLRSDVKAAYSSNRFKYLTNEKGVVSITDSGNKLLGVVGTWDGFTFTPSGDLLK